MVPTRAAALCGALIVLAAPARGDVPLPPPAASAGDQGQVERAPIAPMADASLSQRASAPPSQAWSCTVASLAADRPCLLEGERGSAAAPKRRRDDEAIGVRDALCAQAAPASARSVCELVVDTGAAVCGSARASTLLDDQGRFRPDTGACVSALRDVVATLSTLLDDHAACCACLHRGSPASDATRGQCLEGVAVGTPPDGLGEQHRCDRPCAALLLRQPAPAARRAPTMPKVTP